MYKPGIENRVANVLSRRATPSELYAISALVPSWLDEVTASYTTDPRAQELLQRLALSPSVEPHFELRQGILRHKGHIWIGANIVIFTIVSLLRSTRRLWVATRAFQQPITALSSCSRGRASNCRCSSMFSLAQPVSRLNQTGLATPATCRRCLSR